MSSSAAGEDEESTAARVHTEEEEEAIPSLTCICSHCGKRFESDKALGGHMRIHQSSKSAAAAYKKLRSSGEEVSCEICGKKFESRRSVYGHMRTHPEREWRGMQSLLRPCAAAAGKVSSASLSSTVSDSHNQMHDSAATVFVRSIPVTDLTKYLSFWSVTGKRGRKGKRNDHVSDNAPKSPEPRSRPFKKKMKKLSDLEANHHRQEPGASNNTRQLHRHGGSFNWPEETESATKKSSVTNSTKNDVIMCKNSDNKGILKACCREELYDHSAGHGGRKLPEIDLNEIPTMEEEDDDEDEGIY